MPRSTSRTQRIALVGTRGVPARYGGFETAVEEVGRRLADAGHEVVVYCRTSADEPRPETHLGMQLVHLPAMRRRSLETLSHTGLSVAHLLAHRVDAAIVFNAANAPWLPLLRAARIPVATHVDGLEWKRAKWGGTGKRYYRVAEALSVRWSDALIADAQGIADYYRDEFGAPTELIAYGAPKIAGGASDKLADARPDPARLPPGRRALRAGEPRPRHRRGLPAQRRRAAAGRRRLGALRRRVHAAGARAGRRPGPVPRRRLGPGAARPALRQLRDLPARALRRRHQPLAAAGHRRGSRDDRLRRGLQPRGAADRGRYFATPADVAAEVAAAEADPVAVRRDGTAPG